LNIAGEIMTEKSSLSFAVLPGPQILKAEKQLPPTSSDIILRIYFKVFEVEPIYFR